MTLKKMFFLSLISLFITVFAFQIALAADPDWKEKQKKFFEISGLKPGDIIDASNWQKVQNYLPESIAGYVKKGDYVLKIGEMKYELTNDEGWDKATEANRGKYALGARKEIIDKATGKFPMYVFGRAFPDLDKNDPDVGIKIMHQRSTDEARVGNSWTPCTNNMVGEKGHERQLWTGVTYNHFWCHPNGERPNPNLFKFMSIVELFQPYDLSGTVVLTHRPLDGTADRGGSYVPALRRVRKTSGTNRSDPFFGTDGVVDDGAGWAGQNESMSWKLIGEKVILQSRMGWQAEHPDVMVQQPNGAWKAQRNIPLVRFGYCDKTWKGAPWALLDVVWVPREMYIVEATPLDPYYNYGKQVYYVDKQSGSVVYKAVSNRAGEHWKTLIIDMYAQVWGKNRSVCLMGSAQIIDDKRHHASPAHSRGELMGSSGLYADHIIVDPNQKDEDYTFERIATRSK